MCTITGKSQQTTGRMTIGNTVSVNKLQDKT